MDGSKTAAAERRKTSALLLLSADTDGLRRGVDSEEALDGTLPPHWSPVCCFTPLATLLCNQGNGRLLTTNN